VDDESGESMEPMEEVPLEGLGEDTDVAWSVCHGLITLNMA